MTTNQHAAISWLQNNWFKIVAIIVLIGALGHYPYAYYQMTRWVVSIAALYAAYHYHQGGRNFAALILACLGILFNPIAPFYLTRNTWQYFDALAAAIFAMALFYPEAAKHTDLPTEREGI